MSEQYDLDARTSQIVAARTLRERLLADPYRPGYHFVPPEDIGMPGDPNGAFYANGRYHLMYLYSRRGRAGFDGRGFSWGHISSSDLVHWRHHPDAIGPSNNDGGCFSGGAFVDDDGTAYLSYWRLPRKARGNAEGEGIGIARSVDRHYERWEKLPTPSLDATEWGIREQTGADGDPLNACNADPSNIWKKDGAYYMQAGNLMVLNKLGRDPDSPTCFRGDWVDLLRSSDLAEWEFSQRFYQRDPSNEWTQESEDDMCPSFLPLPSSPEGGEPSDKWLQLFISHNLGCQYYIGEYDLENNLFLPENHGRMTWVDNMFFAPEALIDDRGRQIMWAWVREAGGLSFEDAIRAGWSGTYGIPRLLWLADEDTLGIAPAPELEVLRYNPVKWPNVTLSSDEQKLDRINGTSCELQLTISNPENSERAGVKVRCSPDRTEATSIYYDAQKQRLCCDTSASGSRGALVVEEAPFELKSDEPLGLQVFVDNSVVEVFANQRQAITRLVYPDTSSDQVQLFCDGGSVTFQDLRGWEMMPSNPH